MQKFMMVMLIRTFIRYLGLLVFLLKLNKFALIIFNYITIFSFSTLMLLVGSFDL